MKTLNNSFVYSYFNNWTLVCNFTSQKSTKKLKEIRQHCLRILLNDNMNACRKLFLSSVPWK